MEASGFDSFCRSMKTTTTNSLDTLVWLLDVDGHAGALRCSGEFSGGDGNERERRGGSLWRGGMDCGGCEESPGREKRHGATWKALGGDVSSPASSVAFHRAAWVRGARKKTPLPLVGRVGWLGRLRLGDR